MKKNFLGLTLISTLLILGGCGKTASRNSQNGHANLPLKNENGINSSTRKMMMELPTGTISDLKIGEKIIVNGKTNSDGTILADRIIVGEWRIPPFRTSTVSNQPGSQPSPTTERTSEVPPVNPSEQTNYRNSPQSGNYQGRSPRTRPSGSFGFINGEILKIDTTNIVLKQADGNSKIIFLSASTTINLTPSSTDQFIK